MHYEEWRSQIFDHPLEADPFSFEYDPGFHSVEPSRAFGFVDRVLVDPEVHSLFSKDQLGAGINIIYSPCYSDLPFLYTTECDENRRVEGIGNLVHLYHNYFERYCTGEVTSIGDFVDGPMGYICYMFWDVFVLYPGSATPAMTAAAVEVMRTALYSRNDMCATSAIHGLGHWTMDVPEAAAILKRWLAEPTTANKEVLQYAEVATTGMIQ